MISPYYNASIRKITTTFGTFFNDITIVRKNSNDTENARYKVPLSYGAKSNWYLRDQLRTTTDIPEALGVGLAAVFPRMGYELSSMQYDNTKQLNNNRLAYKNVPATPDVLSISTAIGPVPYSFNYQLTIAAKYMVDGLQILEQILPYFAPAVNVKIKELDNPLIYNDVRFELTSVTSNDNYIESLNSMRIIEWQLDFKVIGNLYPPIQQNKIIRKNIIKMQNSYFDPAIDIEDIDVSATPGSVPGDDPLTNSTVDIIPKP